MKVMFRYLTLVLLSTTAAPAQTCDPSEFAKFSVKNGADLPALEMRSEFAGEDRGVWIENPSRIFGPSVRQKRVFLKTRYLSEEEIAKTVAHIGENGELITGLKGTSFIFVVTEGGELRIFPKLAGESSFARVKHSSLVRGERVRMAGELETDMEGRVVLVTNRSGHYLPRKKYLTRFLETFIPAQARARVRAIDVSDKF